MELSGASEVGPADIKLIEDAPVPAWIKDLPISEVTFVHAGGWEKLADLVRQYRNLEVLSELEQIPIPVEDASLEAREVFWSCRAKFLNWLLWDHCLNG